MKNSGFLKMLVITASFLFSSQAYAGGPTSITKTANPSAIPAMFFGQLVTYTISYENTSASDVGNYQIWDSLPWGYFYSSSTGGVYDGYTVTWTLGTLPAGTSGTVEVVANAVSSSGPISSNIVIDSMGAVSTAEVNQPSPTFSPTATPLTTDTATPLVTDTATPSMTDTATPLMTDTITPSITGTAVPATPVFTGTATFTATAITASPAATVVDTMTPTMAITVTATWTNTQVLATQTFTSTQTGTPAVTGSATGTYTVTATITLGNTATGTMTPTSTVTMTVTPTVTQALSSATYTMTMTGTFTRTATPSGTFSSTLTQVLTPGTNTFTPTATLTLTSTPTSTGTVACTGATPVILVRANFNKDAQFGSVIIDISSSIPFSGAPSIAVKPHSNNPEESFTSTLVPGTSIYRVIYPKQTGYGDIDAIKVTYADACGNTGVTYGEYEKTADTAGADFRVYKNVINPGKGERTRIVYNVYGAGSVKASVYNKNGSLIKELFNGAVDGNKAQEEVIWEGVNTAGKAVVSGTYVVTIETDTYTAKVKVAVVR